MARSWDELSPDHKIVLLLESFVQNQVQGTPIACRVCDQVFFDNKSLLTHFQGHFHPDGSFNPNSIVRNSAPQYNHSLSSVPVNARNNIANENLGSAKPATLVWRDPPVSKPSNNPVQFRGPASTHRHHPYPATLTFREPESRVPVKPVTIGDLGLGKNPQRPRENKVGCPFASITRPLIIQLEKPIEEMMADVIDVDADELDLTLKL